ncbi:hypothetical protein Mapa_008216 [Marchantia paleacea]|nr:hypothetical protein Mapa_008216 [Marchantia paleacea]
MASVFAFLSLGIFYKSYILYNTRKETEARKKGDPELIYHTQNHKDETSVGKIQKRVILARLVYGMYDRFRGKPAKECQEWWTMVHYHPLPLESILTQDEIKTYARELRKERKHQYFGVFLRNKERPSSVAPDWVVAIRGTEPVALPDLHNDLKIVLEMLHTSSLSRLLEAVIRRLGAEHGYSNVCVTGHSLGAAAGLLVCRRLALKGCPVESHFFNPPFATLESLVCSCGRIMTSVLSEKFMAICVNALEELYEAGNHMRDKVLHAVGDAHMRSKALAEFKALAAAKWSPYLYLNEHDLVCSEYLSHFSNTAHRSVDEDWKKWYSPVTEIYRNFLGDPETFHLIPAAVLCTIKKYPVRRVSAHMLWNWMDPDIQYEVNQTKLV